MSSNVSLGLLTELRSPSFVESAGTIYFAGFSATGDDGQELWKTDGTDKGTKRVKDLYPGVKDGAPSGFTPLGGKVIFASQISADEDAVWVSDGTESGTKVLKAFPRLHAVGGKPATACALPKLAFFVADDGVHGRELWATDGTVGGTHQTDDIVAGEESSFSFDDELSCIVRGSKMLFTRAPDPEAENAMQGGLYETDGTSVKLLFQPPDATTHARHVMKRSDGRWLLVAVGEELQVWLEDPKATGGATLVGETTFDPANDRWGLEDFGLLPNALVFRHYDAAHGSEPWVLELPPLTKTKGSDTDAESDDDPTSSKDDDETDDSPEAADDAEGSGSSTSSGCTVVPLGLPAHAPLVAVFGLVAAACRRRRSRFAPSVREC